MKRTILLFSLAALVAGCSSDDPSVESMQMNSSATTLYYDSELPTLSMTITPDNAKDKSLVWNSSKPEVLDVDADGKLTLKKFEYTTVIITATNEASGQTASCEITLAIKKAKIEDYGIIELKNKLGFDLLDRNLGATCAYSKTNTDEQKEAAIGDYYQFGNSIPVATVKGTNKYYDKKANGGDLDWSKAENTPCPEGWRIPNQAEMKKLTDAAWVDWDGFFQTDEEFYAAKDLYNSLLLPAGGYYKLVGDSESEREEATPSIYLAGASFFWSCELNATTPTSDRGFKYAYDFEDNNMVIMGKKAEAVNAMPIRCIK